MIKLTVALLSFVAFFGLSFSALAMDDPDLEGPIVKINTVKNEIMVQNIGKNSRLKNKQKKVLVKQGMINGFRMNDYVQVRMMADNYEAAMIEKMAAHKKDKIS